MNSPEVDPQLMPVLTALDEYQRLSLPLGVGLVFYALDNAEPGFTAEQVKQDLRYDRSGALGACHILCEEQFGYLDLSITDDGGRGAPQFHFQPQPHLQELGAAYNRFSGGIMANILLGTDDVEVVRSLAIQRYALGFSMPEQPFDVEGALQAAEQTGKGHRESVVYRALSSLAVISRIDTATSSEVKRIVRYQRRPRRLQD